MTVTSEKDLFATTIKQEEDHQQRDATVQIESLLHSLHTPLCIEERAVFIAALVVERLDFEVWWRR